MRVKQLRLEKDSGRDTFSMSAAAAHPLNIGLRGLLAISWSRFCLVSHPTLFTILMVGVVVGCDQHEAEALPQLSQVKSLALVDQNEAPFTVERLRGKWSVANFIFTSCPTVCPVMTQRTRELHESLDDLGDKLQFVSFSVDPEVDTPKVLRRYAVEQGAKHGNWWFVTGDTQEIGRVAEQGFRVAIGEKQARDHGYDILHATHFILVDPQATIRGYYRNDDEGMTALKRDLRKELKR